MSDDRHNSSVTETQEIQIYKGRPRPSNEQSGWKRFTAWLLPWMRQKEALGNDYLEAEIRKLNAEAAKLESEAMANMVNAKHIASLTAQMEHEKANTVVTVKERKELLEAKLERLSIEHGGSVRIELD